MAASYNYDNKLEGNILAVGQAGCGETTFIQNLVFNSVYILNIFRQKTSLICTWHFFQRKRHVDNDIDIAMGENNIFDKLFVMDNISGLCQLFGCVAKI